VGECLRQYFGYVNRFYIRRPDLDCRRNLYAYGNFDHVNVYGGFWGYETDVNQRYQSDLDGNRVVVKD